MADTDFLFKTTIIPSDWLNEVNKLRHGANDIARGSALLQYVPSGVDAVPSSAQQELDRHIVSSLRFMSEAQRNDVLGFVGSVDVQSPLQKVIDYVAGLGGGTVQFVPGKYLHGSTLTVSSDGVVLRGSGRNTELLRTGDFGDSVMFTGNDATGTVIQHCGMDGFRLNAQGTMTSGALLHLNGCYFSVFDRIWNQNGFHGFWLQATAQLSLNKLYHFNASVFGGTKVGRRLLYFTDSAGAYAAKHSGGIILSDFNMTGVGSAELVDVCLGLEGGIDGLWINNGHFGSASVADMLFNNSTAIGIGNVFVGNTHCDGMVGTVGKGIHFTGNTASSAAPIEFTNVFVAGGAASAIDTDGTSIGIHADSTAIFNNVLFSGCTISSVFKQAVLVESSNFFSQWTNLSISAPSVAGQGLFDAVDFGAACGNSTFNGGRVQGANLDYAFGLNATSTKIIVDGMDLSLTDVGSFRGTGDNTILVSNCMLREGTSIASASTITVPLGRNYATISGSASIDNITARSRECGILTLVVEAGQTPTFKDTTGNLFLNGDFAADGQDSITLICDGTNWREVSRSTN